MDVNAVEQRAADALLVAGDGAGRAATRPRRVAVVAAGAPVRVTIQGIAAELASWSGRMHAEIRAGASRLSQHGKRPIDAITAYLGVTKED